MSHLEYSHSAAKGVGFTIDRATLDIHVRVADPSASSGTGAVRPVLAILRDESSDEILVAESSTGR